MTHAMKQQEKILPFAHNHISVDCVVLGFDGEQLKVLLVKRVAEEQGTVFHDSKLPGSIIYQDENLDEAAKRVLFELTGIKNINLQQFKAFGSKDRTKNPKDIHWLEKSMHSKIDRIVTIAYLALVKIDRANFRHLDSYQAQWVEVNKVADLAFDHNLIIREAMNYIRQYVENNITALFTLLPRKFTASQFRTLYQLIKGKKIDVRNFHRKMAQMKYVIPLEDKESGVAHRAARYYRFDKVIYNKLR